MPAKNAVKGKKKPEHQNVGIQVPRDLQCHRRACILYAHGQTCPSNSAKCRGSETKTWDSKHQIPEGCCPALGAKEDYVIFSENDNLSCST